MSESQRICSLSILRKHIENRQNPTKILFHMIMEWKGKECSLYGKNMVKNIRKHYGTLAQKGIDTDM